MTRRRKKMTHDRDLDVGLLDVKAPLHQPHTKNCILRSSTVVSSLDSMHFSSQFALALLTNLVLDTSTAFVPSRLQHPKRLSEVTTSSPLKTYQIKRPSYLLAKKKGPGGGDYKSGARGQQPKQEKKSVQDARLDAAT